MPHAFLHNLLAFLAAAVLVVPLFQRFGLGTVLGYLAAGSLIGPWGLQLFTDVKSILSFAESGVVLLLFVIGLELKPSRLWVLRKAVFGMGGGQVAMTTLILSGAAYLLGVPPLAAAVTGFGLSLSSTAFALQMLAEKNQINTSHGRSSFAILLFQDLAIIPVMGLIPLLAPAHTSDGPPFWAALLKVAFMIGAIIIAGRFLLPRAFRLVASARSKEVFTAATLLLVIGIAMLMELVGLSAALGTFLAGVLLADSEYRHEFETDIDPFKGLLLGLFFMGVGMSVDYGLITQQPLPIFGIAAGFMAVKYGVVRALGRLSGLTPEASAAMAMALPHGGEFAFVLFGLANQAQIMSASLVDTLIVAVTLSMAFTPILAFLGERYLTPRLKKKSSQPFDPLPSESNPVIVAGYGRFGQIIARILRVQGIGVTALEHDPEQVQLVRRFGGEIYYGDASRLDLLETAGASRAKAFVLAIDNMESSLRTARVVKQHFPHLKVFARARNRTHAFELMNLGITLITRETFASSLEVAHQVLRDLGKEKAEADEIIAKFRKHDEETLIAQRAYYQDETKLIHFSKKATQQLADLFHKDTPP